MEDKLNVGITHGDINGISYEIIIKALLDPMVNELFTPVVYGSGKAASYHRKVLGINDFSFNIINPGAAFNHKVPNLVNVIEGEPAIELGKSTPEAGAAAVKALEVATNDLLEGTIDVLVTAPFHKSNTQSDTFKYPGHTEYLAERAGVKDYLMLLVSDTLRVGTVTGHLPLKDVAANLSVEKILAKLKVLHKSLQFDFGVRKPKIAVLGLNPHAGDNGLLGSEELNIIKPAVEAANKLGIIAYGPYGADGFFGSGLYKQFDGILAMYHDQGLVPFKTIAFHSGVNFTAGLPFVRTSPDHGTGYDIAGKNEASEESLLAAIYMAIDIYKKRAEYTEINSNPLAFTKLAKER
jgi:4-hydroxythreonine-4-phosphate dehydrogenase